MNVNTRQGNAGRQGALRRSAPHTPPVYIVVVESHQHVLEHIHAVLRKRKLLGRAWSMVHFDAHPDLACGDFPAKACFQPSVDFFERKENNDASQSPVRHDETDKPVAEGRNLYEMLDSTPSGIAEWILPLVLGASLEKIDMFLPSCSNQLPDGSHSFLVGCWVPSREDPVDTSGSKVPTTPHQIESFCDLPNDARVKVDWETPYYWEDHSVVPAADLCLSQTLRLDVWHGSHTIPSLDSVSGLYVLDVCLDYFGCRNPFLVGMQENDGSEWADFLIVLARAVHDSAVKTNNFQERWTRFIESMKAVFECCGSERALDGSISDLLAALTECDVTVDEKILRGYVLHQPGKVALAMESLENLLLPHDVAAEKTWKVRFETFINFLGEATPTYSDSNYRSYLDMNKGSDNRMVRPGRTDDPLLVTIARSTVDGFTPAETVDCVQKEVIGAIHNRFCPCGKYPTVPGSINADPCIGKECRVELIYDYGEWEGSTLY